MKIKWSLFLLIANIFFSFSQNPIEGKWIIDNIIGYRSYQSETIYENEYVLTKIVEGQFPYGNSANIKKDGTFYSGYSAECGNDCFSSVVGKYKIIDENHLSFQIDTICASSYCKVKEINLDKQAVVYYIVKNDQSIKLIKSDGILKNDRDRSEYSRIIGDFENDRKNWSNLGNLNWYTLTEKYTTNEQALTNALKIIKNYALADERILYSKSIRGNWFRVFLVEYSTKRALFILDRQNISIIDIK